MTHLSSSCSGESFISSPISSPDKNTIIISGGRKKFPLFIVFNVRNLNLRSVYDGVDRGKSLTFSEEINQAGHLTDGNTLEEIHLDQLPDQPQHQPLLALAGVEGVAVDADDDTADGLGGVDGQGQVLVLLGGIRSEIITNTHIGT